MLLTRLTKHDEHEIRIHLTRGLGPHYAALRCHQCNRHIQWLSREDVERLTKEDLCLISVVAR